MLRHLQCSSNALQQRYPVQIRHFARLTYRDGQDEGSEAHRAQRQ